MVKVSCSDINFQDAVAVVPVEQQFVVPVPAFENGGVPLIYPHGDKNAGEAILNADGKAQQGLGIVFFNEKEKVWQGVPVDGTGAIVLGGVTQEQAKLLFKRIKRLTNDQPENLTPENIRVFLKYVHTLGIKDVSQTDVKTVDEKMNMMSHWATGYNRLGLFTYQDAGECLAVRYMESVNMENNGTEQEYTKGCVVVKNPTAQTENISTMKPEVFLKSYSRPSGAPLTLFDVPLKLTTQQSYRLTYDVSRTNVA